MFHMFRVCSSGTGDRGVRTLLGHDDLLHIGPGRGQRAGVGGRGPRNGQRAYSW